mmetsp:Transcript_7461/g.12877  ORF Transcript_7461/g.12877 Transcript_7461/m.12877 type:complete len:215 (+) Transcript_7461:385-1029(+)
MLAAMRPVRHVPRIGHWHLLCLQCCLLSSIVVGHFGDSIAGAVLCGIHLRLRVTCSLSPGCTTHSSLTPAATFLCGTLLLELAPRLQSRGVVVMPSCKLHTYSHARSRDPNHQQEEHNQNYRECHQTISQDWIGVSARCLIHPNEDHEQHTNQDNVKQKAEIEHIGEELRPLLRFSLEPRHFFKGPEEHDELVNVDGPVHILVNFLHHCGSRSL